MAILINQRFGKHSEKLSQLPGQLSFNMDDPAVFNEIEAITDHGFTEKPSFGYASYHTLNRKHDDLKVAGCWVHCKRKQVQSCILLQKLRKPMG